MFCGLKLLLTMQLQDIAINNRYEFYFLLVN